MAVRKLEHRESPPVELREVRRDLSAPAYQAFMILRTGFTVAPIVAGADKFFDLLTQWSKYLWDAIPNTTGIAPQTFMYGVGIVEILGGLLVAIVPRFGAWIVGAWLWAITLDLVLKGGYWDIALRDFGLGLGAFALARLAQAVHEAREH